MPLFSTNRGHIDEEKIRTVITRLLESLGTEKSIWEYYNDMAAVDDGIREVEWRDLADTVLVFDGLFAAFLSAFLVFLVPQLQPNSADITMDVLIHISRQLNNSTTPAFEPTAFQVPSNVATVNSLFFLSLALVLIDAFLAMLVKRWLRGFDREWRKHTVAHLRAQERERRLQELERWKMDVLIALLPILIQGSLLLFSIGLLVLIFPLHLPSAILFAITFASGFYGFITYVSIVNDYAPFSSPMSRFIARSLAITSATQFNNPQPHVNVLERLVSTTVEAVESVPIFVELLDQPVKNNTLRPSNMNKWKELLHITLGMLRDRSTSSLSAARTLARTMMICYDRETPDRQLCLTLQHHLGSKQSDDQNARIPLDRLFHSWMDLWLGHSTSYTLNSVCQAIAFLEPSDAADAELLWMVNTSHRIIRPEIRDGAVIQFFVAVLTYVSSTEQSIRSQVPLTTVVIYALRTIRSALDRGGIDSIDRLCLLPETVPTSESAPMTFCQVDGIGALDLWSEDCIQVVQDLLQQEDELCLPLIAALYIDSTKQAHARSMFTSLLRDTSITNVRLQYSGAYDHGKLAVYWYIAVTQKLLDQRYPTAAHYDVIEKVILELSTLQLPRLHILEMAVTYAHKTASPSSDWLTKLSYAHGLQVVAPGQVSRILLPNVDPWLLLHLDTLLTPKTYISSEEVKKLEWSDTPEKVHIASARLALYDSLAKAENNGTEGPQPDPELLSVFLSSKDYSVCTRAFKWCLKLVPISQPGPPIGADITGMFIPKSMGHEWIGHFVRVLCSDAGALSWEFLKSHLVPKWTMLPSSWCRDFSSAFLFSIVHPSDVHGCPAYRFLAESIGSTEAHELSKYLSFLSTMLEPIQSMLTLAKLTSLENWFANIPETIENKDAHTRMEHILSTRRQQLTEETLGNDRRVDG